MDYEEKKKRQLIRVIIAETGMVLSVIAIVVVAIMLAMGFFISGDGQIEQSGLMQIHSLPTGATVELDGATLFSRTNLSKTMPAGTHHLKISKDGYDTWENDVEMYSGVLVRLYYPRLFLQNREVEFVETLGELESDKDLEFYQPSPGRNYVLYAQKGSSEWKLLDLKGDTVKETVLDLSGILPGMVMEEADDDGDASEAEASKEVGSGAPQYRFDGEVKEMKWSTGEERVLVKVNFEGKTEWVLVNLRNVAESLNLSKTFGLDFERIEIIDGSASQLLGLENRHLRSINTSNKSISAVLLDRVADFAYNEGNVLYVTSEVEVQRKKIREIGVYKNGEEGGTIIDEVESNDPVKLALSEYYDDKYVCYTIGSKLRVRYGNLPSYKIDGATVELKDLVERDLDVVPQSFGLSSGGEYVVARSDKNFMVTDLDMGEFYEYEAPTAAVKWLDASMMYVVEDGEVTVWDFDGTNLRDLNSSRQDGDNADAKVLNWPVIISANNRWMYYLVEDKDGLTLAREKIRD